MALHAPANQPAPAAGPSGARGAPLQPPHRKRFRQNAGGMAEIVISSDVEDNYADDLDGLEELEILHPRRKVKFARTGDGEDEDDKDVEFVLDDRVAGPAPKEEPPAAQAGPAPVAAAVSPFEEAVEAVLGILPDLSRSHLKAQLLRQPSYGPADIEAVLEGFLSMQGGYPKEELDIEKGAADRKGKGRATDQGQGLGMDGGGHLQVGNTLDEDEELEGTAKTWLDSAKRAGKSTFMYREAALDQLLHDFPLIRIPDLRTYFAKHSSLYAPTFVDLTALMELPVMTRGIRMLASPRSSKGKGRQKEDEDFEREREWVANRLPKWRAMQRRKKAQERQLEEEIKAGAFFECGCCFGDTAISQLITCSEGCQFCPDCVRGNADNEIGLRKYVLKCMSTDVCPATFPESELVKCLPRKTLGALHKIKQEKEVDEAEIEGLAKCPFCPFAMIIDNPDERLFLCRRPDCRIVSCRDCGKRDHLPKTCAEMTDSELKLKSVHHVEEAMTEALIRRCPKPGCGEPYVKETGTCNKVRCSNCGTLSCYICNKIIEGYQHFKNPGTNLPIGLKVDPNATCALWDDTDTRNFQEVEAARMAAEAEARRLNAELELKEDDFAKLKMDKPAAPNPKIAHLPPPQVPAYNALFGNRGAAVAGPARPLLPPAARARAPPPAPVKPPKPPREAKAAAPTAAERRRQARAQAVEEARRHAQELAEKRRQIEEQMRVQQEEAVARVRARMDRQAEAGKRAAAAATPPQAPAPPRPNGFDAARARVDALNAARKAVRFDPPPPHRRNVAPQAGPSGARLPDQRDVFNPLPAPAAAAPAIYLGPARKRAGADVDAAREAKRARLSGAKPAA
ncbi:hypothetical protein JCM10908_006472 [Rhodotorula pacifica]|uniref:E3 ubiquitin-protein ligase RNF216 n=1 Tax=Rhodotorula pacifica TaxID=1495444 RepID=UPI003171184A